MCGRREGLKSTEPGVQSACPAVSQLRALLPWCHPAGLSLSRLLGVSVLTRLGSEMFAALPEQGGVVEGQVQDLLDSVGTPWAEAGLEGGWIRNGKASSSLTYPFEAS